MAEFFKMLTALIQQYTIADTANLFGIIEGIATVVAAVGAIIAVFVTIKISREQINLAKKQNEISDKQADIAMKQNHLVLFNERHDIYEYFIAFFSIWVGFPILYNNVKNKVGLFETLMSTYCLTAVELNDIYSTKICIDDAESLRRFQAAYFRRNSIAFGKLINVFDFSPNQIEYLEKLKNASNLLLISIFAVLSGDDATLNLISFYAISLSSTISSGSKEITEVMNGQIRAKD
jgi:hypothetical protein